MPAPAPRLVLSHLLTAVGTAVPLPVLLAEFWDRTHAGGWLTAVGLVRTVPYVLLSGVAGLLADRVCRLRILRISAITRAVLLAVLAVGLASDVEPAVLLAAFALTVAAGLPSFPALAAGLPLCVEADDRARSTSWLAVVETVAWSAGPPVGALLLLLLGPAGAVSVAAALAGVGSLILPRVDLGGGMRRSHDRNRLRDGAAVLRRSPGVRRAVLLATAVNVVGGLTVVVLPDLADEQAGGRFGLLALAFGGGALAAPLLARRARRPTMPLLLAGLPLLLTVVPALPPVALGLALSAAGSVWVEMTALLRIQDDVPAAVRARVFGLADMLLVSGAAVGAVLASVAGLIGPVGALVLAGVLLAAAAASRLPAADSVPVPRQGSNSGNHALVGDHALVVARPPDPPVGRRSPAADLPGGR